MKEIDKLIKAYLEDDMKLSSNSRTADCLGEDDLVRYLTASVDEQTRQIMEHHIAGCGYCLSQLSIAVTGQKASKNKEYGSLPQGLVKKTKSLLGIHENNSSYRSIIGKNLWLAGTIVFFLLSFIMPRYFLQFLVAALILGIRWAFESESGRTLIMVLDSWRRHSSDKNDEISRRLNPKL